MPVYTDSTVCTVQYLRYSPQDLRLLDRWPISRCLSNVDSRSVGRRTSTRESRARQGAGPWAPGTGHCQLCLDHHNKKKKRKNAAAKEKQINTVLSSSWKKCATLPRCAARTARPEVSNIN
ncbi:hypothetical protein I7I50_07828 [Histoplasma capsulatum G186AR]|uniref:Uncharacterized protein n=1 Tax=Ajellomyces capsulatus TaxID=5037 RepID=A0A8H7YKH1_AJECA|nr:hypothetical protein I7I52_08344 [Histoplasma capsulatum]QSS68421.1 hypothetical protein I7I50_07828 [Histoplasma capsulatum G186AR]